MSARIRALREQQGLSQQALAARAGLTRQLVGAMEAGRHTPNVTAALAVARVLGVSVEELFGDVAARAVPIIAGEHADGPVRAGRVGDDLVVTSSTLVDERWGLADGLVADDRLELFPGNAPAALVVAGCDPLLGTLAEHVERATRHRVLVVHASSGRAIEALRAGRAHVAVVHGPAGSLEVPPGVAVRRWRLASWRAGLAGAGRRPIPVEELASRRAKVLQREPGASTQAALQRALAAIGADAPLPGPVGSGHLDVARRVRSQEAPAGVTMEAAALALGLAFAPLEEHEVEVWIDERWHDLRAALALVEVLGGTTFARAAATIAGYDLAGVGTAVGTPP